MTPSQRTSTVVEDEASTKEVGFAGGSPYFPRKGRKEGRKEGEFWQRTTFMDDDGCLFGRKLFAKEMFRNAYMCAIHPDFG